TQVPPRVSWTVRLHRRWPRVLPALLPVVQPPTPTLRARLPHPGHRPLQPCRRHPSRARTCATSRVRRSPRTFCSPGASPTAVARISMDQQTCGGLASTVVTAPTGLTRVDKFRGHLLLQRPLLRRSGTDPCRG